MILSGCFFLDTSVLLSEILNQNTSRIEKIKKDVRFSAVPCYISDSVVRECKQKIEDTVNFLGNIIRTTIKLGLEESRRDRGVSITSPIASEDIIALEKIFSLLYGSMRKTYQLDQSHRNHRRMGYNVS